MRVGNGCRFGRPACLDAKDRDRQARAHAVLLALEAELVDAPVGHRERGRHAARSPRVRAQADAVLRDLFRRFKAEPELMPEEWQADLPKDDESRLARRVADYIAGMTDRYAILEHRRLFDVTPDLR